MASLLAVAVGPASAPHVIASRMAETRPGPRREHDTTFLHRPLYIVARALCTPFLFLESNLLKCINALKVLTVSVGNTRERPKACIKPLCGVEPQHAIE